MKPKLKLVIDIKADIENAKWFIKYSEFVDSYLPSDFEYITSKKFSISERNKIITKYTKDNFNKNRKDIEKGVEETRKYWLKIESKYYALIDEIFKGYTWPKGNYTGYVSIYLMFPRNITEKTFFFPYSKTRSNPIRVIAHEMLHFIFFDYINKKYKIKENDEIKGKGSKYVWQVSETFNTVIEKWQPYRRIVDVGANVKPYQGCEEMYKSMTKQWTKDNDIDSFLDKWLLKEDFN